MTVQLALDFVEPDSLERFGIFHYGSGITYGDVSRHLRKLRLAGRDAELAQLLNAAIEQFGAASAGWRKLYGSVA